MEGFFRYFGIAFFIYLFFWILLGPQIRHRLIQGRWPAKREVAREILYSLSTVVIIAFTGLLIVAGQPTLFKIYVQVDRYGWPYFFLSVALIVLAHDAYFYWTHRLMHLPLLFSLFHRLHHRSLNPSPWAAYAFSPWEAAVHAFFLPLYLLVFPTHVIVVFIFLYHMVLRNVIHHLGIELFPRGFTLHPFWGWNATTTHHSLHHMRFQSNFGFYFTFWDRAMKTLDRNYNPFYQKATRKPLFPRLKTRSNFPASKKTGTRLSPDSG